MEEVLEMLKESSHKSETQEQYLSTVIPIVRGQEIVKLFLKETYLREIMLIIKVEHCDT